MTLTPQELQSLSEKTKPILFEAGRQIFESWNSIETISYKDSRDLVTEVDVKVENYIKAELHKVLPEAGFIVEEGVSSESSEYNWVIDPIDGTKAYATQLPMFVTQIALLYKGEPVLGQVYHPVSSQFFCATTSNGTYYNNKKVEPIFRYQLTEAVVEVDLGGKDEILEKKTKIVSELIKQSYRVKISGACLFSSYLLTGTIDAFVILDSKIKAVDYLPYFILFKEAGFMNISIKLDQNTIIYIIGGQEIAAKIRDLIEKSI